MKTLYLESIAGIAGDMFAASFVDAGIVSIEELRSLSAKLDIPKIDIHISKTIRSTMQATHLDVIFNQSDWVKRFNATHHESSHAHAHVPFRELEKIIKGAILSEKVKMLASNILDTLAEAEAHCHGMSKDTVVFHELGMADSLMDIVMAAYCIDKVSPNCIIASPVKLGRGMIKTAHGTQPVPPPVSAALVTNMSLAPVPHSIQHHDIELSTPTGLAILKTLKPLFSPDWPEGKMIVNGCGAGTMDLGHYPNLFRIAVFENDIDTVELPYEHDTVIEITANYDDATPEYLSWAANKLFEQGALDVWQIMAVGKKGRMMVILAVLVEQEKWRKCADFIMKKTSTFGLRHKRVERLKLKRHFETRTVNKDSLQVKIGCNTHGKKIKEKYEFEELREIWNRDI